MNAPRVLFEITRDCDRSCVYCYNPDRRPPRPADLTASRLELLLDRLCTASVSAVTIIGGEPLTVAQLADVAARFARRGVRVGLATNALQLDHQRIDELCSAGVQAFEVSLDSPASATHAALTGTVGLARVRRALAELRLGSAEVMVGAMLTRRSLPELDDLLTLCFALGVSWVGLNQLAPVGHALEQRAALALSGAELEAALTLADRRGAELGLSVRIGLPVEPCRIDHRRFSHLQFEACRCGHDKWLVEPDGSVRICELSATVVGNLFETPFEQLARGAMVSRFRRDTLKEECFDCSSWPLCRGGCRFLRPPASAFS